MVKNTSHRRRFIGLLIFPAMLICATVVKAQPNVQQAQTAQQKFEEQRASRITSMRLLMTIRNLTDEETQNTLITFLTEQATTRKNVREQKTKMTAGMRDTLLSDAQILELLKNYRVASEQAKADYNKALVELDKKIGYSKNPRLETTLVLLGIIGDEDWVSNGPANFGIYADAPNTAP